MSRNRENFSRTINYREERNKSEAIGAMVGSKQRSSAASGMLKPKASGAISRKMSRDGSAKELSPATKLTNNKAVSIKFPE